MPSAAYSSVGLRKSECIALTIAESHDIEIKAADVLNAYVMVLNREFRDYAGKSTILVRALNGLKSAGALLRVHLVQCLQKLVL